MQMLHDTLTLACQKLRETLGDYSVSWEKVIPAYDGIVFIMDKESHWKYWYSTGTVTKLAPWRGIKRGE